MLKQIMESIGIANICLSTKNKLQQRCKLQHQKPFEHYPQELIYSVKQIRAYKETQHSF
jgi:hypothetical protein